MFLGCDGNLNVSALFQTDIIAMFVSQRIFDTEISISTVGAVNSDLGSFGLVQTRRRDDFVDRSRHADTGLFRDSYGIEIHFRYSC